MIKFIVIGHAALALALGSAAWASVDTTPEKTIDIDCASVRRVVATYGAEAVIASARANGVSEKNIAVIARRCLR